jgi:hypothetical protein
MPVVLCPAGELTCNMQDTPGQQNSMSQLQAAILLVALALSDCWLLRPKST